MPHVLFFCIVQETPGNYYRCCWAVAHIVTVCKVFVIVLYYYYFFLCMTSVMRSWAEVVVCWLLNVPATC